MDEFLEVGLWKEQDLTPGEYYSYKKRKYKKETMTFRLMGADAIRATLMAGGMSKEAKNITANSYDITILSKPSRRAGLEGFEKHNPELVKYLRELNKQRGVA